MTTQALRDLITDIEALPKDVPEVEIFGLEHRVTNAIGIARCRPLTNLQDAMLVIEEQPGRNKAAFIAAALYQQNMGDIPDDMIAKKITLEALWDRHEREAEG